MTNFTAPLTLNKSDISSHTQNYKIRVYAQFSHENEILNQTDGVGGGGGGGVRLNLRTPSESIPGNTCTY